MKIDLSKAWREYRGFALFIFLMIIFRSALADWNVVPTGSMKPTILEGDRILVNKLAYDLRIPLTHISIYRFANPKRGDIVIFGLPGDMVAMTDNRLTINGIEAQYLATGYSDDAKFDIESYPGMSHRIELAPTGEGRLSTFGPVEVPKDRYLVLGDNRDNSADSRVHGFIPRDEIVGSANTVVLSLNYDNYYLPRAGRFFHPL